MKSKKIIALLLSFVMVFSFTVPVFAAADAQVSSVSEENGAAVSVLSRIKNILHRIIERIFALFGRECPYCENEGTGLDYMPDEIAAAYNKAVNDLKGYKGKVKVTRKQDVNSAVSDATANVAKNIVEEVVKGFDGTDIYTYTFNNGTDKDGGKITDKVMPFGIDASLVSAGTVMSSAKKTGEITVIEFKLIEEESHFDGTAVTEEAEHNSSVAQTINFGALELGPMTVTGATASYTGTTVKAEIHSSGRLVELLITQPISIYATCKAGTISFATGVDTVIAERYIISYDS